MKRYLIAAVLSVIVVASSAGCFAGKTPIGPKYPYDCATERLKDCTP